MTTFRSEPFIAFACLALLGSCSDRASEAEVERLRSEVEGLRAGLEDVEADAADDAVARSWEENQDWSGESPTGLAPPIATDSSNSRQAFSDLSDRLERDRMKRDLDALKRDAELDRIDRDIEGRKAEAEKRKDDLNRRLGIDY
ncbi:MAG: hypothetical protein WCY92_09770 [Novosphingobium sp.]